MYKVYIYLYISSLYIYKKNKKKKGATLLAVGSSSPELFTALLGVIFYPHDNPGPGTNVGSAIFNMCVIVGLSAIFAPKAGYRLSVYVIYPRTQIKHYLYIIHNMKIFMVKYKRYVINEFIMNYLLY